MNSLFKVHSYIFNALKFKELNVMYLVGGENRNIIKYKEV